MLRVVLISQWLEADGGGFVGGIARSLARQGVEVTVVAGTAVGAAVDGAPRPWRLGTRKQQFSDYRAVRYPFFRSHDQSAVKRALTYTSFSASTGLASIRELARHDVVLVYSSPATAAWAGMVCKRLTRTPYVLLVQDVWPDSIFASGFLQEGPKRRLADAFLNSFVDAAYNNAAAVVAISPGMRELLVERGVSEERAHFIYNWADESLDAKPYVPPARPPGERFRLMYSGNLGFAQDLANVFQAISLLPAGTVKLTLLGSGAAEEELRQQARDSVPGQVEFLSRVAIEDVPAAMANAHMHLISLADEELFRITLPSKLQFLLAAGVPILSAAPGEVSQIVEGHGVGLAAVPGDPLALAHVIRRAAALSDMDLGQMATRARGLYNDQMSASINAEKLLAVLVAAAATRFQSEGPATKSYS